MAKKFRTKSLKRAVALTIATSIGASSIALANPVFTRVGTSAYDEIHASLVQQLNNDKFEIHGIIPTVDLNTDSTLTLNHSIELVTSGSAIVTTATGNNISSASITSLFDFGVDLDDLFENGTSFSANITNYDSITTVGAQSDSIKMVVGLTGKFDKTKLETHLAANPSLNNRLPVTVTLPAGSITDGTATTEPRVATFYIDVTPVTTGIVTDINNLEVTITAPSIGYTPAPTVTSTDTGVTFGSITWNVTGNFAEGDTPVATFTATADQNHKFDTTKWTVDDSVSADLIRVAGAASVDITAANADSVTIRVNYYKLTTSVTSVLGDSSIVWGDEDGTVASPITGQISIDNTVTSISHGDIHLPPGGGTATFFGTDSTFDYPAVGPLSLPEGTTKVYFRVTNGNAAVHYELSITKSASSVDTTALDTAITEATTLLNATKTSTDGTDVHTNEYWATAANKTIFGNAITAAQTVANNTEATQSEVDAAITALNTAKTTFDGARTAGTKEVTPDTDKELTAKDFKVDDVILVDGAYLLAATIDITSATTTSTAINATDITITGVYATNDAEKTNVLGGNVANGDYVVVFNVAEVAGTQAATGLELTFTVTNETTVNTTALEAAIEEATKLLEDTKTSTDGADIPSTEYWATAEDKAELSAAIDAAKAVLADKDADQDEVDDAVVALEEAIDEFEDARELGSIEAIALGVNIVLPTGAVSGATENTDLRLSFKLTVTNNENE